LSKLMNLQGIKILSQPVNPSVSQSINRSASIFCLWDSSGESTDSDREITMHSTLHSSHDSG